jgi:hypothetical protein
MFVRGRILGPFAGLDYHWNGDRLHVASVDPGMTTITTQSYDLDELAKLAAVDTSEWLIWRTKINDQEVSLRVPFRWHTFNVNERVKLLPLLLLAPQPTNFERIVKSIEEQSLPHDMEELATVSLMGAGYSKETMQELLQQMLATGGPATVLEELETRQVGKREVLGLKARLQRGKGKKLIMKQYAFEVNGQWLLCQAYATDEQHPFFEKVEKVISKLAVP